MPRCERPLEPIAATALRRREALQVAAAAVLAGLPTVGRAQTFPIHGKSLRILVGFSPGIGVDMLARAIAPSLAEDLGVPVLIDNRPGASTRIAVAELLRSAPDGHTVMLTSTVTLAQNPHTLLHWPYDSFRDFTPISLDARGPMALVVSGAIQVASIADLRTYASSHPQGLNYGSMGIGSSSHIFGEVLSRQLGGGLAHVPYKGPAEISNDLLGGRLQLAFIPVSAALADAAKGKVRILGLVAPKRNELAPDIPTLTEQGLTHLEEPSWIGWFGPPRLPPAIADRFSRAVIQALARPSVRETYRNAVFVPEGSSPQAMAEIVRESYERWRRLTALAGVPKQE